MTNLQQLTENLIIQLERLKARFEEGNKPDTNRDYFMYVKKETEPIFQMLEEWETLAVDWINQKPRLVYVNQINATTKSMKALLLHSYYIDVRKRRYMEIYKSCRYIFNQLLKEIEE